MHTNCLVFYGNLCYGLNTDSEHLYVLKEQPAAFTQLKSITFLLRR